MNGVRTDSFVFFHSYYNSIMSLKDDEAKVELLKCICLYAYYGELYESKIDYVNAIFESHKFNIDHSIERREINQRNGSMGGAPAGNQNARKQPKTTENNQTEPENNLNADVNVNANADKDENLNKYVNQNGNINLNAEAKVNDNVFSKTTKKIKMKKKLYEKAVKNLMGSDLDSILPEYDINKKQEYLDKLRANCFMGFESKKYISTVNDFIEDFKLVNKKELAE